MDIANDLINADGVDYSYKNPHVDIDDVDDVDIDDKKEKEHWDNVMRTFLFYEDLIVFDLERKQKRYNKLNNNYIDRLPQITFDKFSMIHEAAKSNQKFFNDMVYYHAFCNNNRSNFNDSDSNNNENNYVVLPMKDKGPIIRFDQQHRNQAVLHSLYREFSKEGQLERHNTFTLLIQQLQLHLPLQTTKLNHHEDHHHHMLYQKRVLVPGCGIGRLPLEISALGYACEGKQYMNEWTNEKLDGCIDGWMDDE